MICRACYSTDLGPLPFEVPASAGGWRRCRACGSDTAAHGYDASIYTPDYVARHTGICDAEHLRREVRTNCGWYARHGTLPGKTFLDVGCCEGSALHVMAGLGWDVSGWDVVPSLSPAPNLRYGPAFSRWAFPRRFDAVMCREVLEHVESPDLLLHELAGAALPGGLVQVQTPRPLDDAAHPFAYQTAHLCLIPPDRLKAMLSRAGLVVVDELVWGIGHAYLCRA